MSDWTEGYLTEIDYTHGYYRELSPFHLRQAVINQAIKVPEDRPVRYLELGFGQGLSLAVHAAATPGEYWGTDFNPAQAANAKELVEASGTNARIFDLSFEELANHPDLPEFDVITMHGIWSWVNDENRAIITDLIRRKLAVGGLLFVSYNCYPGWAQTIPLRHLLSLHVKLAGASNDGIIQKIDKSLEFAKAVSDNGSLFFAVNNAATERLKAFQGLDRHYVAHEYFNQDWHPLPFSTVAEQLSEAKLSFATSANYFDQLDGLNLNSNALAFMNGIQHPILRESVRDYMTNRQFRRDIFVKGPVRMKPHEHADHLRQECYVLTTAPQAVERKHLGTGGELNLPDFLYNPLLEILASDNFRPKSVREIEEHPQFPKVPISVIRDAITILVGANHLYPVQTASVIAEAQPYCHALNRHIIAQARYGNGPTFLASPLTGTAFYASQHDQIFLGGYIEGLRTAHDLATYMWSMLRPQGIVFTQQGQVVSGDEATIAFLTTHAQGFLTGTLPRMVLLGMF